MVGEMSVRGNVLVGKCPVGEVSGRGIVRSGKCPWESVRSANCPTISTLAWWLVCVFRADLSSVLQGTLLPSWKIQLKFQTKLLWSSYLKHLRILKISEQINLYQKPQKFAKLFVLQKFLP